MPKATPTSPPPSRPPSAIRRALKISRRTFFDPASWLDADALQQQNKTIIDILKSIFTIPSAGREETFAAAMARLGVDETDVVNREKRYQQYAFFFAALGVLVIGFSFYLLFTQGTFTGWLLGMASGALLFGQAFKYDFWRFQIKHRKLGCTFEEWKQGKILSKVAPKEPPHGK